MVATTNVVTTTNSQKRDLRRPQVRDSGCCGLGDSSSWWMYGGLMSLGGAGGGKACTKICGLLLS